MSYIFVRMDIFVIWIEYLNIGSRDEHILHLTCKLDTSQLRAAREHLKIMVVESFKTK